MPTPTFSRDGPLSRTSWSVGRGACRFDRRYAAISQCPPAPTLSSGYRTSHLSNATRAGDIDRQTRRTGRRVVIVVTIAAVCSIVTTSGCNSEVTDARRGGRALPGNSRSIYRIIISRAPQRPHTDVLLFSVRAPIPDVPIPLRDGEPEPLLPLNRLLHDLYDRAGYDLAINDHQSAEPPLAPEDAAWAAALIREHQR